MKKRILKILLCVILLSLILFIILAIYKINIIYKENQAYKGFLKANNTKYVRKEICYQDGSKLYENKSTVYYRDGINKEYMDFWNANGEKEVINIGATYNYNVGDAHFTVFEGIKDFTITKNISTFSMGNMMSNSYYINLEVFAEKNVDLWSKWLYFWGIITSKISSEKIDNIDCYKFDISGNATIYIDKEDYMPKKYCYEYDNTKMIENYEYELNSEEAKKIEIPDLSDYTQTI